MPPDDAPGLDVPPVNAASDMQRAVPVRDAAAKMARQRQKAVVRFPYALHGGITPAMNRAIERLTAGNSLLAGADVLRMSLHSYLLQNDPQYGRELSSCHGGG
jgi:hypothetical protein